MKSNGAGYLRRREHLESIVGMLSPPADVHVLELEVGGVLADLITPPEYHPDRVIIYVHGGTYTTGSRDTHRLLACRIARVCRSRVLLPEYRLAPENTHPAALDDVVETYEWLVGESEFRDCAVTLMGDTAGGGLALAAVLSVRTQGIQLPSAIALISPWLDLTCSGVRADKGMGTSPGFEAAILRRDAECYSAGLDKKSVLISPLYSALDGLPPIFLQAGKYDVLYGDSTRLAEKAKSAAASVTLDDREDTLLWQYLSNVKLPTPAIERIGKFFEAYWP